MNESLGDYILDRTESLDDNLILEYFIDRDNDKIKRLLDSEQYLLEGSRGVGKTMLMKAAMLESHKNFEKNSVLAVWISFEESIRLERIKIVNDSNDPFLQWTMGKILFETLQTLVKLRPKSFASLNIKLAKIFGTASQDNHQKYFTILNDYIKILEKGDIKDNNLLEEVSPSKELLNILDSHQAFKDFVLSIIKDFGLSRIVYLFDEAAHVFSFSQQEKFFNFFKSLRNPNIACKAAVYPGITNYGKYFERGHDAKEIRLEWSALEKSDIEYIKEILKKRIQSYNLEYWKKLTNKKDIIDLICVCSNGNPRFAFHIIDELGNNKVFQSNITNQILINSIRSVFNTKWKEFDTLKQRLKRYEKFISEAEYFMKDSVLPNMRIWNDKQRDNSRKFSIGLYISTKAYDYLEKIFSVLAYSNIINIDYSKRSLGHHKYGYYVTINPSLLFTDLIIKDINELQNISIAIENNQAYHETSSIIKDLIEQTKEVTYISCTKCDFKTTDENYKFCPKCGSQMEQIEEDSLYKVLRSHSLNNLKLSNRILERLESKFKNIGELYDAEIEDLRMKYIGEVRIILIKNAVVEYMAG